MLKEYYILHQSHEVAGGSVSAVWRQMYKTENEAIIENRKNHRDYYDISNVYIFEKDLNIIQRFIKKLFRI